MVLTSVNHNKRASILGGEHEGRRFSVCAAVKRANMKSLKRCRSLKDVRKERGAEGVEGRARRAGKDEYALTEYQYCGPEQSGSHSIVPSEDTQQTLGNMCDEHENDHRN